MKLTYYCRPHRICYLCIPFLMRVLMKKLSLTLNLWQQEASSLPDDEKELLEQARAQATTAYAPYSAFGVGAALLLANGEIIAASNQENSAFPSGMCAERVALQYAGARFPGVPVKKLVIAVKSEQKTADAVYAPCGGCRQVMSETEYRQNQEPMEIIFEGPGENVTRCTGISELMPFTFKLNNKS